METYLIPQKMTTYSINKKAETVAGEMYLSFLRKKMATCLPQKKIVISNTFELELICAHKELDDRLMIKARSLIEKGIDWCIFTEDGLRGRLAYLFYNSLSALNSLKIIPEYVFYVLKTECASAALEVSLQYNETMRILGIFYTNKIPVIPLKGPVLSKRLYGNILARGISADIDIFIEEKNKKAAVELLKSNGYTHLSDAGLGDRLGQYNFWSNEGFIVDLHCRINSIVPSKNREEGLWQEARVREESNIRYYELTEEELLLQLAVHMSDSVFFLQLRYFSDIHELLFAHQDKLNWESIVEKSKRWQLSTSLYVALKLCKSFFGSPVTEGVLFRLRPGFMKRMFIGLFVNKEVLFNQNSIKRRFIEKFLKYFIFQILEARLPKDYFVILFPQKEKMINDTYLQRIVRGLVKFTSVFK